MKITSSTSLKTGQKLTFIVAKEISQDMRLYFEKEVKNNFHEKNFDSDGFDQNGF